jgi:hypothetical protein
MWTHRGPHRPSTDELVKLEAGSGATTGGMPGIRVAASYRVLLPLLTEMRSTARTCAKSLERGM